MSTPTMGLGFPTSINNQGDSPIDIPTNQPNVNNFSQSLSSQVVQGWANVTVLLAQKPTTPGDPVPASPAVVWSAEDTTAHVIQG